MLKNFKSENKSPGSIIQRPKSSHGNSGAELILDDLL
jgi:hypothetical protein